MQFIPSCYFKNLVILSFFIGAIAVIWSPLSFFGKITQFFGNFFKKTINIDLEEVSVQDPFFKMNKSPEPEQNDNGQNQEQGLKSKNHVDSNDSGENFRSKDQTSEKIEKTISFEGVKYPTIGNSPVNRKFYEIRQNLLQIINNARKKFDKGELGFIGSGNHYPRVLKISDIPKYDDLVSKNHSFEFNEYDKWFFIGDVHGDFFSLFMFIEKAKAVQNFRICFLGDLVDRGPYSAECFGLLLKTVDEFPNQILWIAGNHDIGIKRTSPNLLGIKEEYPDHMQHVLDSVKHTAYDSDVAPAEFLVWLNKKKCQDSIIKKGSLGKLFTDVCETLPRAILFPNGLLATHGGIPLSDRWDTIKNMEGLLQKRTLNDFVWNRASDVKFRMFDQSMRATTFDFEFGSSDLENFCKKVDSFFHVLAVLRGHDHVAKGVDFLSKYTNIPLITLNGFGFNHQNNSLKPALYKDSIPYFELDHSQPVPKDAKLIDIDKDMLRDFYVFD